MDPLVTLALVLSAVIGWVLGVLGGGGSILAVPMLVFVANIAPSEAVGMSLGIVGATSLVASYAHHRRGLVRVQVALHFGGAGIVTAFFAARLTRLVAPEVLMLSFAVLTMVVGGWMLSGRGQRDAHQAERPQATHPRVVHVWLVGALVGGITGFLGVGGGFLVVPALIAFAGLDMREAVGTALLVIAINSVAAFAGHLVLGIPNLGLVAAFSIASVVGAIVGERMGRGISTAKLRRGFAALVFATGVAVAASSAV